MDIKMLNKSAFTFLFKITSKKCEQINFETTRHNNVHQNVENGFKNGIY